MKIEIELDDLAWLLAKADYAPMGELERKQYDRLTMALLTEQNSVPLGWDVASGESQTAHSLYSGGHVSLPFNYDFQGVPPKSMKGYVDGQLVAGQTAVINPTLTPIFDKHPADFNGFPVIPMSDAEKFLGGLGGHGLSKATSKVAKLGSAYGMGAPSAMKVMLNMKGLKDLYDSEIAKALSVQIEDEMIEGFKSKHAILIDSHDELMIEPPKLEGPVFGSSSPAANAQTKFGTAYGKKKKKGKH